VNTLKLGRGTESTTEKGNETVFGFAFKVGKYVGGKILLYAVDDYASRSLILTPGKYFLVRSCLFSVMPSTLYCMLQLGPLTSSGKIQSYMYIYFLSSGVGDST
jgi:hypothetical protein